MLRSPQAVGVISRLQVVPATGLALTALVLLNLMWGGSLPATKLALLSFGPFSLAAARLLLASALFVSVLGPTAVRRIPLVDGLRMLGLGVVGFAGVQMFQALGTSQTSGATATVLASTAPLFIALLAPGVLGEQLRITTLAGLTLAMVGVAAVMGLAPGQPPDLAGSVTGDLIVLLSSLSSAVYSVLGKRLVLRYPPLTFCTVSCLGGALASLPLAVWELATTPVSPSPVGWVMLAYLGILVTFVGFVVWFWGLRALSAGRAGALIFLQPISGLVLASVVLGDHLTPTFLLGCGLVVAGVYVAVARVPGSPPPPQSRSVSIR
jgi:drug/metabolite transporter (DMT)-like permease